MNRKDRLNLADEDLLNEAEAYDASLRGIGLPQADFVDKHSELAAVFRLLKVVFESPKADLAEHLVHSGMPLPANFKHFRIVSLLGRGGFSTVYRAFDEVLQRDVAIKIVPVLTDGHSDRCMLEARAAARLNHGNIVPLYEVHRDDNAVYLVSEFCEGSTLAAWLQENPGRVQPDMAAEIVLQLTHAVAHSHSRGLVHRDIKPTNVLLSKTQVRESFLCFTPRLTDFGLARDLRERNMTASSTELSGTFEYMAPEQILGSDHKVQVAVDIYSLGVLLYRLLTGSLPHEGATTVSLLHNICTEQPIKPRELEKTIPRDLEAICLKCLSREIEIRYAQANELADDIVRWKQGRDVIARPQTFWERNLRTLRISPIQSTLIASIFLIATTAVTILAQLNSRVIHQEKMLRQAIIESYAKETRAVTAEHEAISALEEAATSKKLATLASYRADVAHGFGALNQGRLEEARNIGQKIQHVAENSIPIGADLRILNALASRNSIPFTNHRGPVSEVVVIPNFPLVVSAGEDGIVRFHDTSDGSTVREIATDSNTRVHAMACTNDGKRLAIGYATKQEFETINFIRIVDWEEWDVKMDMRGFPTTVESIEFSPDGTRLAIGCRYQPITIRSMFDPQYSISLPSDRRNEEICFSPDGNKVLLFDSRDHLCLYDSFSGAVLQEIHCEHQPHHLAWSADGRWIAISNFHHPFVYLFQAKNLSTPSVLLSQPFGGTNCIAFSVNSDRLIAGLRNGSMVSWDLTAIPNSFEKGDSTLTLSFKHKVTPNNTAVSAIASLSDGRVICGTKNGSVCLCTFANSYIQFPALDSLATCSAIVTDDGKTIFTGTTKGSLLTFDVATGQIDTVVSPNGTWLTKLALSSDQTFLAIGWENGDVGLMAWPERKMLRFEKNSDLHVPARPSLIDLHFVPQSSRLILFRNSDKLQIWECSRAKPDEQNSTPHVVTRAVWETERLGNAACYIPDIEGLVYGGSTESIRHVGHGIPERVLLANCSMVSSLLYDSARRVLISGHTNGNIKQHKLTGELLAISGHAGVPILPSSNSVDVTKLALSPDGRHLVSGNIDGELRIWDASDFFPIGTIRVGDGQGKISDICFSRDGNWLLYHQVVPEEAKRGGVHLINLAP